MKKPKLLIKVDRNYRAKVYFNNKWHKDIFMLSMTAIPNIYDIIVRQYKRNEKGAFYSENNEIAFEEKQYTIGRRIR